ncbi:peptidyl-prolyl cis-trans isomerase [Paenibacillus hamazuiensis]|uniref:peptidyl-prolyl cis-trans isomerase n=1 Tax=Paenibacillus hamazuiensis TaxID=2936508 RepID=UPI00200EFA9A|nr:peptidyl-prolyl cis-trans isomerase [Paenibacillus hamazuiensis]
MRNVKWLWGIIGLLAAAVAVLSFLAVKNAFPPAGSTPPNNPPPKPGPERIVATVGNRPISEAELQQHLYSKYGKEMLNLMLDREAIRMEGDKQGIKVDRGEIDKELKRMQQGYESEADFYKAMRDQLGMTQDELREDVYYKLLLEKLVTKDIKIPDEWVDDYIRLHPEEFQKPAKLRIQQIVVSNKDQAAKVVDEVKKGADFAQLAKDRSLDDATRSSGGDLGWIEETDPFVEPSVLKAAKALKKGEISAPFELNGKYVIVRLQDRKEQSKEQADAVRERVRKELALHEATPLPEFTKKLRERWNVKIVDPELAQ